MTSLGAFRVVLIAFALIVGGYTLASSLVALGSPDRLDLSPSGANVTGWLQIVLASRSDLEDKQALIAALQAPASAKERSATPPPGGSAQAADNWVKQTLSVAPYNPELWIALALIHARRDPGDPVVVEGLKMAYFTAPNDWRLMPTRLDLATRYDALGDPDLKELARGDVRLMMTRKPELNAAVVAAYRRASSLGKTFLEQAIQSIDPSFLPILRR